MMPWNPIHRYAGLQTEFGISPTEPLAVEPTNGVASNPFGEAGRPEAEFSFGYAAGSDPGGSFADTTRRPFGFVDVRSEAEARSAEPVGADGESGASLEPDAVAEPVDEMRIPGLTGADGEAEAQTEEAAKKVPFYKREIGFGRKKDTEPELEPAAIDNSTEPVHESVAESDPVEIPVADATAVELEPVPGIVDETPEVAVDEPDADVKVPFYKRELSIRRRRADFAAPVEEVTEDPVLGWQPVDDAEATVDEIADPVSEDTQDVEPAEVLEAALADTDQPLEPGHVAESETDHDDAESPAGNDEGPAETAALQWPDSHGSVDLTSHDVEAGADPHVEDKAEPALEPASEIAVSVDLKPARKRDLSFGKSRSTKLSSGGRGSSRRPGKIVGLKIGASQLAAAVVEEQNGRSELVELARTPLEAGIVVDGEVRDPEALTSALRSFFADNKLPTRDVRIGIASNRIGVRTFDIAGVDDDARFDNAVRFKAHEVLPIAGNESVLDYRVLDERRAPTGEATRRIFLVVAPRDQVAPYAEAAQRAGLKLSGVDLESLGLLRAFVEPQEPGARKATDTATVVVAIGHEASTLMVSGGGVCEFTRVFDWGGSTLQEAIVQELDVRPAEAATILRHLSLAGSSARIEGLDDEARGKAVEAVRLRLTPFARELVSSLQFYQTQPDSLGIGEIVITGGTSQLDGLADALNQIIGVSVRVGDPLQRVAALRGVEAGFESVIGSFAVAIGLGIDDLATRSVDLTPRDIAKESTGIRPQLLKVLLPIAAAVPLAAAGFLFYQAHGKVSDRKSQLSALESKFAALPQPKRPQIDPALQGIQAQRASAVAQVLGARTTWDSMLSEFARVLPANVWLTTLSAKTARPLSTPIAIATPTATPTSATTSAMPATATSPTGVTITGYTYTQADVALLLSRLSALPSLQNVQLQSSAVTTLGKKNVMSFTILADLPETGGAS
jgi:type IV pilus assembly protein PilM